MKFKRVPVAEFLKAQGQDDGFYEEPDRNLEDKRTMTKEEFEECGAYVLISMEAYKELCRKAEAVDEVRAEIDEEKNDYQAIGEAWSDDTAYGLQLALDIIDNYLKGEMSNESDHTT